MGTVKNAQKGQIPLPDHKHCLYFGLLHNLFLLSEQIQFLCVSRVNFPHVEFLAPLSR